MKYLKLIAKGAVIGVGMIIPGVSGGTLAVLLGIYEDLILHISSLRKNFKDSIKFLSPILLGMIIAFLAMYFPLKLALEHIPFEVCMVFSAMMICSTPKICMEAYHNGFQIKDILFVVFSFALCLGLCFIPMGSDIELNFSMAWYFYMVLFVVGVLASVALVVPGISGSMLLLILGLYLPLLNTISNIKNNPGESIAILSIFAVGLVIGFFTIAKLMRFLLKKWQRQTMWAIVGFVVASIIAIFLAFDFKGLLTPLHVGLGIGAFIMVCVLYFGVIFLYKKKQNKLIVEEN